jgi:hypothetical protein
MTTSDKVRQVVTGSSAASSELSSRAGAERAPGGSRRNPDMAPLASDRNRAEGSRRGSSAHWLVAAATTSPIFAVSRPCPWRPWTGARLRKP